MSVSIDIKRRPFQRRVELWLRECFGEKIAADKQERNHRFIEEALELVQACGMTREEALILVDYVYSRKVGVPIQEVGGVLVTLSALCSANSIEMEQAGEIEYCRILQPVILERIRQKQATKPKGSPLPQEVTE